MSKRAFWAPFWIFALILYGIMWLIVLPFKAIAMMNEDEYERGYRD